jgi:hypothetical protein
MDATSEPLDSPPQATPGALALSPQGWTGPPFGVTVLDSWDADAVGASVAFESRLRIGRAGADGVDLALEDPLLSRRHATLARDPQDPARGRLQDHHSKNGTWAGGERVRSWVTVSPGDIVRVGSTVLEFGMLDASSPLELPVESGAFLGWSRALHDALQTLALAASSARPVLIAGEVGTGRELAARHLHALRGRAGRFVGLPCTGANGRRIEQALAAAAGGTLYLAELATLPVPLQLQLLTLWRTDRDVDVVASTTGAISQQVADGTVLAELVDRFWGLAVEIPPLWARRVDIPMLFRHFLAERGGALELTPACAELLVRHSWPLNARELTAVAGRLAALEPPPPILTSAHLAAALHASRRLLGLPAEVFLPEAGELAELVAAHSGAEAAVAFDCGAAPELAAAWLSVRGLTAESTVDPRTGAPIDRQAGLL